MCWVHARFCWAVEVFGKGVHVGEGSANSEFTWTVYSRKNSQLETLFPVLVTPHVGSTQPKELVR